MDKIHVKNKLIEVGSRIFLEKGYNASGLQQILAEADVPKGSFYYYFASKEDFCISIIHHYIEEYKNNNLSILFNPTLPAANRMMRYFSNEIDYYTGQNCEHSCLIVKFIVELSNLSSDIRNALQKGVEIWVNAIAFCLKDGLKSKDFRFSVTPEEMAESIQSGWIGAMILMQASQSKKPLEDFIQHMKMLLNVNL